MIDQCRRICGDTYRRTKWTQKKHCEGCEACFAGAKLEDNPYTGLCDEPLSFISWMAGWYHGRANLHVEGEKS